ncbi:PadR family transcriptional regulator [Streptomyces malaysiensis]|uniref:PadR family transcriptional regulator n=1 Tax=Streptomyces malaysiensis TaxID=92644 RepID=UPI00341F899F
MSLRHAVLGLLSEEPGSGWDLMQKFDISLRHAWTATQSQVYGELAKLADTGLITVAEEGPRGRKVYEITEEGRVELRRWMIDVAPRPRRDDLILRVFFLNAVSPEEARTFLSRIAEAASERHEELRELHDRIHWSDDALSVYGALALDWGLRLEAMQREWADWARTKLRDQT